MSLSRVVCEGQEFLRVQSRVSGLRPTVVSAVGRVREGSFNFSATLRSGHSVTTSMRPRRIAPPEYPVDVLLCDLHVFLPERLDEASPKFEEEQVYVVQTGMFQKQRRNFRDVFRRARKEEEQSGAMFAKLLRPKTRLAAAPRQHSYRLELLEICASPDSPLTDCVIDFGGRAGRVGFARRRHSRSGSLRLDRRHYQISSTSTRVGFAFLLTITRLKVKREQRVMKRGSDCLRQRVACLKLLTVLDVVFILSIFCLPRIGPGKSCNDYQDAEFFSFSADTVPVIPSRSVWFSSVLASKRRVEECLKQ